MSQILAATSGLKSSAKYQQAFCTKSFWSCYNPEVPRSRNTVLFLDNLLSWVCYYGSETEGSLSSKKAFFLMSEQFEFGFGSWIHNFQVVDFDWNVMTVKTLTVETKEAREIHIDGIQQAIGKKLRMSYIAPAIWRCQFWHFFNSLGKYIGIYLTSLQKCTELLCFWSTMCCCLAFSTGPKLWCLWGAGKQEIRNSPPRRPFPFHQKAYSGNTVLSPSDS